MLQGMATFRCTLIRMRARVRVACQRLACTWPMHVLAGDDARWRGAVLLPAFDPSPHKTLAPPLQGAQQGGQDGLPCRGQDGVGAAGPPSCRGPQVVLRERGRAGRRARCRRRRAVLVSISKEGGGGDPVPRGLSGWRLWCMRQPECSVGASRVCVTVLLRSQSCLA